MKEPSVKRVEGDDKDRRKSIQQVAFEALKSFRGADFMIISGPLLSKANSD